MSFPEVEFLILQFLQLAILKYDCGSQACGLHCFCMQSAWKDLAASLIQGLLDLCMVPSFSLKPDLPSCN